MRVLSKILRRIKNRGFLSTCKHALRRLRECFFDWQHGIRTRRFFRLPERYAENSDYHAYSPSSGANFLRIMKMLPSPVNQDVFIDVGSGMGRVVMLAATYPFRRVIGIELNEELNAIARSNLKRVAGKLECKDVTLVTADASAYSIPDDATIFYCFNPFKGMVLDAFIQNLYYSLLKNPRTVTVIYSIPAHFEKSVANLPWLKKTQELQLDQRYVIYQSDMNVLVEANNHVVQCISLMF